MRIIEVIIEAANSTGVSKATGNPIEDPNRGEGDNKTITGANTKATADNLTPPAEAISIIITIVIMEAEVDVSMVVIITEVVATDEAFIEAITITVPSIFNHSPKHCFKGEHDINNLMEKMSLGSNNQHQNGLHQ